MTQNIKLIVYPVKDVEKAKAFYGKFLHQPGPSVLPSKVSKRLMEIPS